MVYQELHVLYFHRPFTTIRSLTTQLPNLHSLLAWNCAGKEVADYDHYNWFSTIG